MFVGTRTRVFMNKCLKDRCVSLLLLCFGKKHVFNHSFTLIRIGTCIEQVQNYLIFLFQKNENSQLCQYRTFTSILYRRNVCVKEWVCKYVSNGTISCHKSLLKKRKGWEPLEFSLVREWLSEKERECERVTKWITMAKKKPKHLALPPACISFCFVQFLFSSKQRATNLDKKSSFSFEPQLSGTFYLDFKKIDV